MRRRWWIVACAAALAGFAGTGARAADCPGHPDAIGTSRTIVVDPREHPRIGTMQYPETLPLRDHEVVLTFDDGPLPKYSNQVLDILAAECIKATFFTIGRQAQANPEGVRKLAAAGHTIGTHSQNHPLTFQKMPIEKAQQEISDGIASVSAALKDPSVLAPFFRIPGLLRAEGVEQDLASRGIQVWSADFPADDWRHIPSTRVYQLAMQRIEAKGKGILLLHDIQPRTVAALPKILHDLKARGYRIVHVVPATAEHPATPTEPQEWLLHPPSENTPIAHWPKIPGFVFATTATLPAPALSDLGVSDFQSLPDEPSHGRPAHGVPLPRQAPWPRQTVVPHENAAVTLPIPGENLFEIAEKTHLAPKVAVAPSQHAERQATPAAANGQIGRSRYARHAPGKRPGQQAGRSTASTRIASLKKR